MKTLVVYKDLSDHARDVETFLHDFKRQTGQDIETMSPDTPEGSQFCRTYDIVEYPTLVALDDSGQLQNMWRGLPFPTISEVSYYVSQD